MWKFDHLQRLMTHHPLVLWRAPVVGRWRTCLVEVEAKFNMAAPMRMRNFANILRFSRCAQRTRIEISCRFHSSISTRVPHTTQGSFS